FFLSPEDLILLLLKLAVKGYPHVSDSQVSDPLVSDSQMSDSQMSDSIVNDSQHPSKMLRFAMAWLTNTHCEM
uniref:Uncharacterized protein n=1 Tax=Romanomermis culicivorax TaxID=13658 RepID=A0A915K036_ROMCU